MKICFHPATHLGKNIAVTSVYEISYNDFNEIKEFGMFRD